MDLDWLQTCGWMLTEVDPIWARVGASSSDVIIDHMSTCGRCGRLCDEVRMERESFPRLCKLGGSNMTERVGGQQIDDDHIDISDGFSYQGQGLADADGADQIKMNIQSFRQQP